MANNLKDSEFGTDRQSTDDAIRVMLVDDSAIIRGLITKMIASDPAINVVASVADGAQAVKRMGRKDIDVIVLDIEMPVMDGLTALPKLIELDPNVKIIMASTLTERNADISLKALEAGAADYVPKPTSNSKIAGASDFRREILEKIKSLGDASRRDAGKPEPKAAARSSFNSGPVELRQATNAAKPNILAIGSSTGGPQALFKLFQNLKPEMGVPVVVTQHMPPTFTRILADHIANASGWTCTEAKDGEVLEPNHAYVAPGDYHMEIVDGPSGAAIRVNQNPAENYCRPAVDPMLRSLTRIFGGRVLTVILTGMGLDGLKGGKIITDAGGTLFAQDEQTSVVWGMPGAVAMAGLCSAVLPIEKLGAKVMEFMGKGG